MDGHNKICFFFVKGKVLYSTFVVLQACTFVAVNSDLKFCIIMFVLQGFFFCAFLFFLLFALKFLSVTFRFAVGFELDLGTFHSTTA